MMLNHKRFHRRLLSVVSGVAVAGMLVSGCGSSADTTPSATTTTAGTTTMQSVAPTSSDPGVGEPDVDGTGVDGENAEGADLEGAGESPASEAVTAAPEEPTDATTDAPVADSGTASGACPSADELRQVTEASYLNASLAQPVDFNQPTCAGGWATAKTPQWAYDTPDPVQPASVLFQEVDGQWLPITPGSALDCTSQYGVPPEAAAQLPGCTKE